jgi:hypothetical protein
MKTILIILTSLTISLGASAQRKGGVYFHGYSPRVVVVPPINYGLGFGLVYGYPYFGYPFYFSPYGYGYPYYGNGRMPYNLSMEIQSIKVNYRNKIRGVRNDKSISHAQKRQEIRSLKGERGPAIADAQRNFYNNRRQRMNNQNPGTNNYQNPGTNNNQN